MSAGQPDEAGFLKLIEGNRSKILKICRVYAWNASDRDDLYQEILFQIWRALPGLKEDVYAGTWLYRVALNTSISFVRKQAGRNRRATLCGMGTCMECRVTVDGRKHVRSCQIIVREGMVVRTS